MGAYLSQPNTTKSSSDGGNTAMSYGFSAMQGWRVSMEDAHNCIPELDGETALFAVYDGHGGEEVALYCSKYLPDVIKEQKNYKDGKLQKALEEAFMSIDSRMTTEDVIKELVQIAGRPQQEAANEKVAEEDDVDNEEAELLHEEATMTIEELLVRYGQNLNALKHGKKPGTAAAGEGAGATAPKVVNGQLEGVEKEGGAGPAAAAAGGSKLRACRRGGPEGGAGGAGEKPAKGEGDAPGPSSSGSSSSAAATPPQPAGSAPQPAGSAPQSSSSPPQPADTKSRFFEDSDESGEEEEEEGSDDEGSEEDEGEEYSSDEQEDTEEEDSEEEEMCLPGMDGKEEPGSDSGTTAVVALIRGQQLIVANAGDSRCVVSEGGRAVDMSVDHKPEDELELARIKNAGGKVTMDGRVNGGLNLSRAIGDHFYKRNKALCPEEQMISAHPDVKVLTLNKDHDFMVIACDGIWNVLSSQEVVDFVSERIKPNASGQTRALSSIVEELLDHCLAPDTSGDGTGCDNMTSMIVTFGAHPGAASSSSSDGSKKRKPSEAAEENGGEENGSDSKKTKSE